MIYVGPQKFLLMYLLALREFDFYFILFIYLFSLFRKFYIQLCRPTAYFHSKNYFFLDNILYLYSFPSRIFKHCQFFSYEVSTHSINKTKQNKIMFHTKKGNFNKTKKYISCRSPTSLFLSLFILIKS